MSTISTILVCVCDDAAFVAYYSAHVVYNMLGVMPVLNALIVDVIHSVVVAAAAAAVVVADQRVVSDCSWSLSFEC